MDKIIAFKNELRNYKYYQKQLKELSTQLDVLWYDLTGVKGVRYDKEPSQSVNEHYAELKKLGMLDDIEKVQKQLYRIECNVKYIEDKLEMMTPEVRKWCYEIYCCKKPFEKVAKQSNYSVGTIQYHIERNIKKVLN